MNKFQIIYNDESKFNGKSYPSNWKEAPSHNIIKFEYFVYPHLYIFEGFKQYNHQLEKAYTPSLRLLKILIMTRDLKDTFILCLDFNEKTVDHYITSVGHEYGMQVITDWKEGIRKEKPSVVKYNLLTKKQEILY